MNIQDIEPGQSYACKYLDHAGVEAIGVIKTRDVVNERVQIIDDNSTLIVLDWSSIWDVDTVEWSTK